jgi:spore germination protein
MFGQYGNYYFLVILVDIKHRYNLKLTRGHLPRMPVIGERGKDVSQYRICLAKLLVVVALSFGPLQAASAASVDEILQQAGITKNLTETSSSSSNLKDVLVGLLLGNLLNRVFNVPSDALPSGIKLAGASGKKEVVGFYAENWASDNASLNSLQQHGDMINVVSPFWGTINEDGTITSRSTNNRDAVMSYAQDNRVKVTVLLNNAKSGTSSVPVHHLLSDPQRRSNAIANIEEHVKANGFDGVNIDFEMVPPEDRDYLTQFMQELSDRMRPSGYTVAMSVFPKKDEATNDVAIAYDYKALAKYVDQIVVMTYDNHGEWSGPGSVADIKWVEDNLKYALQFIPKQKIYLGIAAYGYDWSAAGVKSVHYSDAMEQAAKYNAAISWDAASKSSYYTYVDSTGQHQVWFENSRSLAYKLDLVNKYDIRGVAIWRLGQEDPGYWQVLRDKLR